LCKRRSIAELIVSGYFYQPMEKARKKDSPPPWIDDAPAAAGHPDYGDIKQLVEKIQARLPGLIS
jgi:hypothetical protein